MLELQEHLQDLQPRHRQRQDGAERPDPDTQRRRLRHRHRRQRRGQVHHAERHRRHVPGGCSGKIIIDGTDVTKLPEHKRAALSGPGVPGPHDGHRRHYADRGESGPGRPPRPAPRPCGWGITQAGTGAVPASCSKTLGLGLEDRLTTKVGLLSGGQRQALTLLMATLKQAQAAAAGRAHRGSRPQDRRQGAGALTDRIVAGEQPHHPDDHPQHDAMPSSTETA